LPANLRGSYEQALSDPELLSTREEQALFTARITEVLAKLDGGAGFDAMLSELRTLREALIGAAADGNVPKVLGTVGKIDTLLDQSAGEEKLWRELASLAETRRKLADTERKRLEALQNSLTAEQATVLVQRLIGILASRIEDRRVLGAITNDLALLIGGSSD
jgi:hypothetical protein